MCSNLQNQKSASISRKFLILEKIPNFNSVLLILFRHIQSSSQSQTKIWENHMSGASRVQETTTYSCGSTKIIFHFSICFKLCFPSQKLAVKSCLHQIIIRSNDFLIQNPKILKFWKNIKESTSFMSQLKCQTKIPTRQDDNSNIISSAAFLIRSK